MPIRLDRISAIAYHPVAGSRSFSLDPVGRQANANLFDSLWRHVFGDGGGGVRYYVSDGGTDAVDVGARTSTDVYAPVNGQVVSLSPDVIDGDAVSYGVTVAIQPTGNPSVVVSDRARGARHDTQRPADPAGGRSGRARPHAHRHGRRDLGGAAVGRRALTLQGGDNVEISVDPAPA